ncbi:hypothetical protein HanRHA438_Chr10g0437061 [Helianthus annuus]|nr:hypothetical protein HanRHA438_Chr10g0437061 [Helianthus annuus]
MTMEIHPSVYNRRLSVLYCYMYDLRETRYFIICAFRSSQRLFYHCLFCRHT